MKVPFVIYADFESFCYSSEKKSFAEKYQKHSPSGFYYYIKCFDDKIFDPLLIRYTAKSENDNVAEKNVISLEKSMKEIYDQSKKKKKVIMTEKEKEHYEKSKKCHICERKMRN